MNRKAVLITTGITAAALMSGAIYYGTRNKKLDHKAALFFSELERQISPATAGIVDSDAFDIKYWQGLAAKLKGKSFYPMKVNDAKSAADTIYDAWGIWDDDEDKVYGVFRALKDQAQVSQLSYWYYQKHKINLIDDLRARMSKEEIGEVMKIVNKLVPYRLGPETKK